MFVRIGLPKIVEMMSRRQDKKLKKKVSHPTSDSASGGRTLSSLPKLLREVPERFDRGHLFLVSFPLRRRKKRWETRGGVEAGDWDRSTDAYRAGKRKKVRTMTNMASSSPRGGGEGPRDKMEMFAFTFCPSFHRFLLEGNIVEEIPFIFRLFLSFNSALLMLLSSPPPEEYRSFLKVK